jgi:uncharacterized membrane protein
MEIGPVEMVVLTFPSERADPDVVSSLAEVVEQGYATILDLVFLSRETSGEIRVVDFDEDLDEAGLARLTVADGRAVLSDEDMDVVRETLEPGTSAALIVYENTWARRVAGAVRGAGGEVALHVQIPRETVEAALAAAEAED